MILGCWNGTRIGLLPPEVGQNRVWSFGHKKRATMETKETRPATARIGQLLWMNFRWHHLSKDIEFRQGRIKGDQVSHKFHEILGIFMHFLHAPPAPKYPTDIDVMDHSRRVSPQDVDPARWGNNGLWHVGFAKPTVDEGKFSTGKNRPRFARDFWVKNRVSCTFSLYSTGIVFRGIFLELNASSKWSKLQFWLFVSPHFLAHCRLTGKALLYRSTFTLQGQHVEDWEVLFILGWSCW